MLNQEQIIDLQAIQSRLAELVLASNGNGGGTITDIGSHFIIRLECAIEKQTQQKNLLTLNQFNA